MLRYKRLILSKLEPDNDATPMQLRELARVTGIPIPSMHNLARYDTLPRIDNVTKLAAYFNESVAGLFSEDDDLTALLVAQIRKLNDPDKEKLLTRLMKKDRTKQT